MPGDGRAAGPGGRVEAHGQIRPKYVAKAEQRGQAGLTLTLLDQEEVTGIDPGGA